MHLQMKKIMQLNSTFHSTISRNHLKLFPGKKYRRNTDFGCFASFRSPLRPCDSSNSSFSPFPSLFCLSCPLLLSSHGPWPWLHVKPDTPHSLFSHHAVTSSAHHTALATASLYLSFSVFIQCCTSVGLASAAGLRWALSLGQLKKSK